MLNRKEKEERCVAFFEELSKRLNDDYEIVKSCNKDKTSYLIPKGTIGELSYYGKPKKSFRLSDHWNWYASLFKCENVNYIQCLNSDMPRAKKRKDEGKASTPVFGWQIALVGDDGKYHHVYGERFDRKTRTWSWDDTTTIEELVGKI